MQAWPGLRDYSTLWAQTEGWAGRRLEASNSPVRRPSETQDCSPAVGWPGSSLGPGRRLQTGAPGFPRAPTEARGLVRGSAGLFSTPRGKAEAAPRPPTDSAPHRQGCASQARTAISVHWKNQGIKRGTLNPSLDHSFLHPAPSSCGVDGSQLSEVKWAD